MVWGCISRILQCPPLKCTIKCCNLTGDQWICGALIWTNLCFIDISDISHTSTSLSCQAVNVTCASLRRAPPHQPVWPRWISAPFFRGKRKVEFPKKSRTSRSSRTHPIKSSPKTVKPLRKNQFQSQKLIAGCAKPQFSCRCSTNWCSAAAARDSAAWLQNFQCTLWDLQFNHSELRRAGKVQNGKWFQVGVGCCCMYLAMVLLRQLLRKKNRFRVSVWLTLLLSSLC